MSKPKSPQRVIWITTDHMRYDCVGANGNSSIHTPNIDFLANNGVSFDNCFCQNPLCMPSRASFMTGLYPQQTGVTRNGHELPPDFEPVVAKCFKAGNYSTAQIGKLHFECHEDVDLDPRPSNNYGFDKFYLAEEPGPYQDAYMKWLFTEHPDLVQTFRVPRSVNPERASGENAKVLDAPWQASFSGWVCEQTKRHIGGFGGGKQPDRNFVHMGFYAPHPPLNPTREMFEPYKNADLKGPNFQQDDESLDKPAPLCNTLRHWQEKDEEYFINYRRHFYAMITGVDMAIGEILEMLRNRGELDDTLIVFSSDHGDMCGDHNAVSKHVSFYDELMHLPLILFWPNGLGAAPRRVSGLVEMVDLLPTLLGLCNINIPRVMAGNNYSDALLNGEDIPGREDVLAYHAPDFFMLRSKNYKYIRYAEDKEVLYDLQQDPGETINQAGNAEYADALNHMRYRSVGRLAAASQSCLPRYFEF